MIALKAVGIILMGIIMIGFDLLMIALPFLFIYIIYRLIKSLMTHDAELKRRQQDNDRDSRPY